MTGTGHPNRSAIRAGRRVLSLFLFAVFLPLLFPAEVWANLTRPPLPDPYPFMVPVGPAAAPVCKPGFPGSQPGSLEKSFDGTVLDNGTHTLSARAIDGSGNVATVTPVTITTSRTAPDTTPPALTFYFPSTATALSGTVTARAVASDNTAVAEIRILVDGAAVATAANPVPAELAYALDTVPFPKNNQHTISATAKDPAGNETVLPVITFTVDNDLPDTQRPEFTAAFGSYLTIDSRAAARAASVAVEAGLPAVLAARGVTQVLIAEQKMAYLLVQDLGKANGFRLLGYTWNAGREALSDMLKGSANLITEQTAKEVTEFGTKWTVEMVVRGANNVSGRIVVVWQQDFGSAVLRFITALPHPFV